MSSQILTENRRWLHLCLRQSDYYGAAVYASGVFDTPEQLQDFVKEIDEVHGRAARVAFLKEFGAICAAANAGHRQLIASLQRLPDAVPACAASGS